METGNYVGASAWNLRTAVNSIQGLGKDYITCMNSCKKYKSILFKMDEYDSNTKEDK